MKKQKKAQSSSLDNKIKEKCIEIKHDHGNKHYTSSHLLIVDAFPRTAQPRAFGCFWSTLIFFGILCMKARQRKRETFTCDAEAEYTQQDQDVEWDNGVFDGGQRV